MTSNPPAVQHLDGQVPGTSAPAVCKRPGCGNALPGQDRGRTRQFCGDECARRYHNDARVPAPAAAVPADSSADPLAALDAVIRQAAVLTRAARDMAAGLDPARVRAQVAEAEAAAVTAEARAAEAGAETQALAEALDTAREDTRAAQAAAAAARQATEAAEAALEQARRDAAAQIAAAQAEAAGQATAARAEAARCARERDDATQAARRADAEVARARQADAVAALTEAERARAERAEAQLEAERADRRHLTSALTAPASPASGNGKLPRAAAGKGDQQ